MNTKRKPVCGVCDLSEKTHIERSDEADHAFTGHLTPSENTQIIAAVIRCPKCLAIHVDEDGWDIRPHRTHKCLPCGILFDVTVRGVDSLEIADTRRSQPSEVDAAIKHLRLVLDPTRPTPLQGTAISTVLAWLDEVTGWPRSIKEQV